MKRRPGPRFEHSQACSTYEEADTVRIVLGRRMFVDLETIYIHPMGDGWRVAYCSRGDL